MSSAYTEQDLREARCFRHGDKSEQVKLGGCLVKECSYLGGVCDDCARIAAEFARIRSEARAGMREACAGACIGYGHICNNKGCHAADAAAIGQICDSAADEVIERIKAEAERKGRIEEARVWREHSVWEGSIEWADKRCAGLSEKEPSHD